MNAYVDESRMTQDVDILSPARRISPTNWHLSLATISDRGSGSDRGGRLGHRLYQLRKPKNRHLVDVRSVNAVPPHQVVDNVLVVPPVDLIGQKVLSMVNRSGTAKRINGPCRYPIASC